MASQGQTPSCVTIIGSGIMGRGIAVACAIKGVKVVLFDSEPKAIQAALRDTSDIISRLAKLDAVGSAEEASRRISASDNLQSAVSPSDLIIESVPEDLELKCSVFQKLDSIANGNVTLATNTSGLSITKIASVTSNRKRIVGIHFFAPAYILKTVEIVPGSETAQDTLGLAKRFARSLGKVPVTLKNDSPNFLVNSIQFAMLKEARSLLEKGVVGTQEEVDLALMHSIPLRQALFGLFEDSDLISPYSSITHKDRKDFKANYSYADSPDELIARRDELLVRLERLVEPLRDRRPKTMQSR